MRLTMPEYCLVVLVGASGSGKSSFAQKHFLPTEVISSDFCRGLVSDNESSQDATDDAFDVLFYIVRKRLAARRLTVIDATCPLVTKVHLEVRRFTSKGYDIVLIGHNGHDEVIGTMGEAPDRIHLVGTPEEVEHLHIPDPERVAYTTQTTLSVDETRQIIEALRRRFPSIKGPKKDDICYATQNRQDAVKALLKEGIELLIVVGSDNSSNSQRLCEAAEAQGVEAHLIDNPEEVDTAWLEGRRTVGLTAGASAPEFLVEGVADLISGLGYVTEEHVVVQEDVHFSLPQGLSAATRARGTVLPTS
ncbi:MAG: 4-hydroxy-3-methylbut-2-enyl diphosphate reductase [Nitrospinae bacterium]|nr:4-hydroxy-3-methylbut-2-enyl diphosphate reductase [Nitrospinota bacterium]